MRRNINVIHAHLNNEIIIILTPYCLMGDQTGQHPEEQIFVSICRSFPVSYPVPFSVSFYVYLHRTPLVDFHTRVHEACQGQLYSAKFHSPLRFLKCAL